MTYPEFLQQLDMAARDATVDDYLDEAENIAQHLPELYAIAHGGFRAVKETSGRSLKAFAFRYGIPLRTLEDWSAGVRHCPEYVWKMLGYIVWSEL